MGQLTLLDIVKANGSDGLVGLIDETTKAHPEIALIAARTIRGISYKTLVRTALGRTTGSFRDANAGTVPVKNTYENRTVECFILEALIRVDKAVADAYEDGPQAMIALESSGVVEGEMQGLASQFFYGRGTNGNTAGFPGLMQAYDSTNMVVDAGGTTASTGSSAWLVKTGPQAVQWVYGNNGGIALGNVQEIQVADAADSTKFYTAYARNFFARPGLAVNSTQSVCRIKKLTADNGKGLTDALVATALSKFPVGMRPDYLFCNRRSLAQLQNSRTATNPTGAPAPIPTESHGIPIQVTDAILSTEGLTL